MATIKNIREILTTSYEMSHLLNTMRMINIVHINDNLNREINYKLKHRLKIAIRRNFDLDMDFRLQKELANGK